MAVGKILKYIRKVVTWIVAIALIIALVVVGAVIIGAQKYLNNNLSNYVSEKTRGVYSLTFEKIELSFKNKGFTITGLNLETNEEKAKEIQRINPERVFYSLSTTELQIHKIQPFKIYSEKKLLIGKISIVRPEFSLSGALNFTQDSIKPFDYAMAEVRQLFNKYLEEAFIGEIEFVDANYQFYNLIGDSSNFSNAKKISIGITDFRTDSLLLEKSTYPFETDDIFVRMNNFRNEMSDNIHFLDIDSLEYSFKKAELSAFNSHLYPKNPTEEKSLYDIFVPSFVLKSKSIANIYSADSLFIDYCQFDSPEFKFYQKRNFEKVNIEDVNNFDLYDLIQNDFKAINIDTFFLNNASLEISRQAVDSSFQQKFSDIDIKLLNFTLDSTSNKNPDKLLFAEGVNMKITGYLLNLNDNTHTLKADTISVSTFDDLISVKGLLISPSQTKQAKKPVLINIGCDELSLNMVGLKNTYHRRTLVCNNVEIVGPKVQLDYHTDISRNSNAGQAGVLFEMVSAYLKGVYSNLIEIDNGSLKIRNLRRNKTIGFFETDFSFSLTDFALDSTSLENTDKLFYASNFDLQFSDYKMKLVDNLHKLSVSKILISSNESKAIIDSLRLSPVVNAIDEELIKRYNKSETYNLFVPKITILNADLHAAFFEKNLKISNLKFHDPSIYFENFSYLKKGNQQSDFSELYQLIFNYVTDISINNASVPNGEITWINHASKGKTTTLSNKFDAELVNFKLNKEELDKKRLLFSDHINFSLRDQLFKLSDNVHFLQAGEIYFSTENSSIEFF